MTVSFFRGKRWRYSFFHDGKRYQDWCIHPETGIEAENRTAAEKAERAIRSAIENGRKKAPRKAPPQSTTLAEMIAPYAAQAQRELSSWPNIRGYLADVLLYFGADRPIAEIDALAVEEYLAWSSRQPVKVYRGGPEQGGDMSAGQDPRSAATTNKHVKALVRAWRVACRLDRALPSPVDIRLLPEPREMANPISDEDIRRILENSPPHLVAVIVLAVHTGMRLREILRLEWHQVRIDEGQIRLDSSTKARRGRPAMVNEAAKAVLAHLQAERVPEEGRVIVYRGKPIESVRSAWETALAAAGLSGRHRFHDLRGSFCTMLAGLGVDPFSICALAGHSDIRVTSRYVGVGSDASKAAVAKLDGRAGTLTALTALAKLPKPLAEEQERRFVGVYPKKGKRVWEARITIMRDGKKAARYLGTFLTQEDAARAYDGAARELGRALNFADPETTITAPE